MTTLWLIDPATLAMPSATKRKIGRKPLIDLTGLQREIACGRLGDEDVFLATRSSNTDLQNLRWSIADLLACVSCVAASDFRGAEWCKDRWENWHPCDVYAIRYDDARRCRAPHIYIEYYLKFSIDVEGSLRLVMIRNHLSR